MAQNQKNSNVVFRRVRGRIIPIRMSAGQSGRLKDGSKGAAAVAAGVAVSAVGGNTYKKVVFKSANTAMRGFEALRQSFSPAHNSAGPLFEYAAQQSSKAQAFEQLRKSKKILGLAQGIRSVAPVVGAGLIGYGALKLVSSVPKDRKKKLDPAVAAGGAGAAAILLPKAYDFSKKAFHAGMHGKQGAFAFAQSNAKAFAPRIKDAFMAAFKGKF